MKRSVYLTQLKNTGIDNTNSINSITQNENLKIFPNPSLPFEHNKYQSIKLYLQPVENGNYLPNTLLFLIRIDINLE